MGKRKRRPATALEIETRELHRVLSRSLCLVEHVAGAKALGALLEARQREDLARHRGDLRAAVRRLSGALDLRAFDGSPGRMSADPRYCLRRVVGYLDAAVDALERNHEAARLPAKHLRPARAKASAALEGITALLPPKATPARAKATAASCADGATP